MDRGVKLTPHLQLFLRLRMNGAKAPLQLSLRGVKREILLLLEQLKNISKKRDVNSHTAIQACACTSQSFSLLSISTAVCSNHMEDTNCCIAGKAASCDALSVATHRQLQPASFPERQRGSLTRHSACLLFSKDARRPSHQLDTIKAVIQLLKPPPPHLFHCLHTPRHQQLLSVIIRTIPPSFLC